MVHDMEFRKFLPLPVDNIVAKIATAFVYVATSVGIVSGISAGNYKYAIIGAGLASAALGATYWYNLTHDGDGYGDS